VSRTRYEWTQEQRRIESAIRGQKDIANLAKAAGDDALRREAQAHINALDRRYAAISEKAGLSAQRERMSVSGFRRVKTMEELAVSKLSNVVTPDGIHVSATIHSIERLKERNVSLEDAIDSLTKPLDISKIKYDELGRPSKQYIGEKATTAVNPQNGNITSEWKTSSKRARKLKERKDT
jgi:hypothetical protein